MNFLDTVALWIANVGEILSPIILFVAGVYVSVKELVNLFKRRKSDRNLNDIKDLLTAIVNKDNCEGAVNMLTTAVDKVITRLDSVETALKSTQDQNILLGQMLATIFQYSSLPIETKEHLEALLANLQFGQNGDYMESLIKENQELRTTLETIKEETKKIAESASGAAEEVSHQTKKGYVQAV